MERVPVYGSQDSFIGEGTGINHRGKADQGNHKHKEKCSRKESQGERLRDRNTSNAL